MKKLITICLLIATTFTVNAQSKSNFRTISGVGSLVGMSLANARSFLNKNGFAFDNQEEVKNNITFKHFGDTVEMQDCIIGIKSNKVVMVILSFDINYDESSTEFNEEIKTFKNSLSKASFTLINEKNETDGWQNGYYHNKTLKQKADVSHFDNRTATYMIYSEEIDLSKFKK